ncbi:flap endonuclease-1 [Candidatus Woesearchaeota archaeon]|nr:flap endonuclease-1 [Candidatus Woesearchaeota archaeon]
MGVQITEILSMKEISLEGLSGKVIAVDTYLFLYQFLTTIRGRDGSPLTDAQGRVTSHLTGIFTRTCSLLEMGVKLVYVFDGKPPLLKEKERERRSQAKVDALVRYEQAVKEHDVEAMKKYAARTVRLSSEMVSEVKELIQALGLPVVEAPSEGEAQAAEIVKQGDAYAVASQDADVLLFGCPRLIRNVSLAGRRKKSSRLDYQTITPELIDLYENLRLLQLTQDQLIVLGMLVGTDYNLGGIKGIGPKHALTLVQQYRTDFDALFAHVRWDDTFSYPWRGVYNLFRQIPTTKNYTLVWKPIDEKKVLDILVQEHNFSQERVLHTLGKITEKTAASKQRQLGEFS